MKALIGFSLTTNLLDYWKQLRQLERRFCDVSSFPVLLVLDRMEGLDRIEGVSGVVDVLTGGSGSSEYYDIARCRNRMMEYAVEKGYDRLLMMDVDGILMEPPRFPPEGYFSCCRLFWSREEEVREWHFDFGDGSRWTSSSYFLMHRADFSKNRFCEDYVGHGGQDVDFFHNVLVPSGARPYHWSTNAIHHWHPKRGYDIGQEERNRALLRRRGKGNEEVMRVLREVAGVERQNHNNYLPLLSFNRK